MKILIIEDEFIIAADLSDSLRKDGYVVAGVFDNGPDALMFYKSNDIDLVLCDITIKGIWDGIETVEKLTEIKQVPIIYLTALTDKVTLERAKKTYPAAYISKPFHSTNLRMAIEMAINNFATKIQLVRTSKEEILQKDAILQINDDIFIKQNYQFVKFPLSEILYLEAESIYTNIITAQKKYVIRQSISNVLERLPLKQLVRVHRSYAVNINKIESFNEHEAMVNSFSIPLGRTFKDDFMRHFLFR
jgi:DNA-binding LytR/AlgR family response regulator